MPLSGREKATIFLSILGAETAGRILRYLPDEVADLIAAGVNHLPTPSPEMLSEVMDEFKSFLALPESRYPISARIEEKTRPKKNYAFLMYERPQMIAYLLSLMPETQREGALFCIPREKATVEELFSNIKINSLSAELERKLKDLFGERLF